MHEERFEVSEETARLVNEAKAAGRRVDCGRHNTSARAGKCRAAQNQGRSISRHGRTRIFIYPPHAFQIVDVLLTNFHLPRSTLLMLVSAFAAPEKITGREMVLSAYAEAIRERYRFFSYGDAMLICCDHEHKRSDWPSLRPRFICRSVAVSTQRANSQSKSARRFR